MPNFPVYSLPTLAAPNIPTFQGQGEQIGMGQINPPQVSPKSDILGLIKAGLGIAKDVYGIKVDSATLDALQAQEERKRLEQERQDRIDEGKYTRSEQIGLLQNYDINRQNPNSTQAPSPILALVQGRGQSSPLNPNLSSPEAYLAQRNGPIENPNSPLFNAVQAFDVDTGEPFWVSRKPTQGAEKNLLVIDNVKHPETGAAGTQIVDPATLKGTGGFYETVPKPTKPINPAAPDPVTGLTPAQTANVNDRHEMIKERSIQKAGTELGDFHTIFLNVKDLENTIADGNYTDQGINFSLDKYKKGETVKIPGTDVPGLGHISFYSAPARDITAKIDRIFNAELLDRSGKAVTDNEMRRLKSEFNAGKFSTIEDQLSALQAYKNAASAALQNAEAKYKPDVVQEYRHRGGFTSKDLQYVNGEIRRGPDGKSYQYNQLQNRWIEK